MTTSIIDVSNILSSNHHHNVKWARKELGKIKSSSTKEQGKIFDLIVWLNTTGDDVMELVKIVMSLVNDLDSSGATKKKEARFLFIKIMELIGHEDTLDFYLKIFDSAVEIIIWAKKGGLKDIADSSKSCFPFRKK
jgi:hypothetical protein